MSLEAIWYSLVALYLFWITLVATVVTALGVSLIRRLWRFL